MNNYLSPIQKRKQFNANQRNRQRMSARELSGIPGFIDSFDYRCNSDDNPELFTNVAFLDSLPPLIRDLMESTDFFLMLGDLVDQDIVQDYVDPETGLFTQPPDEVNKLATVHNQPLKTIRRRFPEFQQHLLHEKIDGWEPEPEEYDDEYVLGTMAPDEEDALAHAEPLDNSPPKTKYDLVEDIHREFSADWFPYPADKRLKGYSCNLAKAIERGIKPKTLFTAIAEAKKRGAISNGQIVRLWKLFDLASFCSNPIKYNQTIQKRIARKRAAAK